jgi:GTPase SAR1 family protein
MNHEEVFSQKTSLKLIVIGVSTAGKTTLIRHLRDQYDAAVLEFDEELVRINGGLYPSDVDFRRNVFVPVIQKDILSRSSVVFFTNPYCFTVEQIEWARGNGFRIVELLLDREEMLRRNRQRMELEGYGDHSLYFDEMIEHQTALSDRGLIDRLIDASKLTALIAEELVAYMRQ